MAEVWVVNASPLIILDRLDQLDLLPRLGHTLVVPGGVLAEISRGPRPITPNRLASFRTATVEVIDAIVGSPGRCNRRCIARRECGSCRDEVTRTAEVQYVSR
jgi:hypothetical protein